MAEIPNMSEIDWATLVNKIDPEPTRQVVYEFSNGVQFYKPFREEGQSIYEGPEE